VLNALKSQQSNVWYYQFKWAQEPAPWNDIYGAAHAFDLPFVFGNFSWPAWPATLTFDATLTQAQIGVRP